MNNRYRRLVHTMIKERPGAYLFVVGRRTAQKTGRTLKEVMNAIRLGSNHTNTKPNNWHKQNKRWK
ncbi:hypothetical protein EFE01_01180 [Latilactobacillus curvatus]|nr:hypothetical protein [Latilactobacillus curvatus]